MSVTAPLNLAEAPRVSTWRSASPARAVATAPAARPIPRTVRRATCMPAPKPSGQHGPPREAAASAEASGREGLRQQPAVALDGHPPGSGGGGDGACQIAHAGDLLAV